MPNSNLIDFFIESSRKEGCAHSIVVWFKVGDRRILRRPLPVAIPRQGIGSIRSGWEASGITAIVTRVSTAPGTDTRSPSQSIIPGTDRGKIFFIQASGQVVSLTGLFAVSGLRMRQFDEYTNKGPETTRSDLPHFTNEDPPIPYRGFSAVNQAWYIC